MVRTPVARTSTSFGPHELFRFNLIASRMFARMHIYRHTYMNMCICMYACSYVYVAGMSIHPFPMEFLCFGRKIPSLLNF